MTRPLPTSFDDAIQRVHGDVAWAWLWLIPLNLQDAPAGQIHLLGTNYHTALVQSSVTYAPIPMRIGIIAEDNEGNLPTFELLISNHRRHLAKFFETIEPERGPLGQIATGRLVNVQNTDDFLQWGFEIQQATLDDEWLTLRMESPQFFKTRIPQDRFTPHRCRWRFGGPECGYIVNAVAAFTTCGKTLDDCVARGDDHVARNLPRLHPERFGGYPGIPQQ